MQRIYISVPFRAPEKLALKHPSVCDTKIFPKMQEREGLQLCYVTIAVGTTRSEMLKVQYVDLMRRESEPTILAMNFPRRRSFGSSGRLVSEGVGFGVRKIPLSGRQRTRKGGNEERQDREGVGKEEHRDVILRESLLSMCFCVERAEL